MQMPRFQGPLFAALGLCVLTLTPLGAGPQAAAAGAFKRPGAWDMTLESLHRQCRLVLLTDRDHDGMSIGMPPGCRRAFPILAKVMIWADAGDAGLRFEDAGGNPVLNFEPGNDAFTANGPEGEVFKLQPVEPARRAALAKAAAEAAAALPAPAADDPTPAITSTAGAGIVAAATAKPLFKPKPPVATIGEVAGHYAVLREHSHDTGCMVTLDEKVPGPKSMLKARLAPACRDQGIIIFDPVGWAIEGGRLVLMARKGHTTHLDPQDDGSWMKDPNEGKSLSLKKM